MRQAIRYVGRVQGVGFRATARAVAGRHPVTGWVRNEADGSVMVEVQGEPAGIEGFRAELGEFVAELVVRVDAWEVAEVREERGFVIVR
jgi:acylphosphatase